jgi:hypothetical protein
MKYQGKSRAGNKVGYNHRMVPRIEQTTSFADISLKLRHMDAYGKVLEERLLTSEHYFFTFIPKYWNRSL